MQADPITRITRITRISRISRISRTLTELDHARVTSLLQRQADGLPQAESLLDFADLVPSRDVPADVVTMYSQVQVADLATGEERKLTLCYPPHASAAAGFISVLSPVGMALLGQRVGAVAEWHSPGGDGAARVLAVLFQPEASGDYTL